MTLSTQECLAAISRYADELATAARGHLDAPVEHCPGWDVAELVRHVQQVHWFWTVIAEELPTEPPDPEQRPDRPEELSGDALLAAYEAGARRMVEVLGAADQAAACWTWAEQQDVAFITRHQVQEAAVHAWDAVHAAGGELAIDPRHAADAVDEFLTFSLATAADAAEEELPALAGRFGLRADDTGDGWTITDGEVPGAVEASYGAPDDAPVLTAPAADLLLWLYRRRELPLGDVPADLVARFREDAFTD
jgi:uncharacterized protein (TIGR03083 family)